MQNKYLQKKSGLPSTTFVVRRKSSAGFTLVETLLAIALLSMAIVAPLTIASSGVTAATTGKDRLIAISLARDAIEHIRSMRDRNRLQGSSVNWLTGISPVNGVPCTDLLGCRVDSLRDDTGNETKKVTSPAESLLSFNTSTADSGLYSHRAVSSNWAASKFYRSYVITDIVSGREVRVTVTISWNTTFATKSIVLIDQLMNW
jgi:type II secretory pathway pseudopilin PulG